MSDYPKILWRPDGREVSVTSASDEAEKVAEGCTPHPPVPPPVEDAPAVSDPVDPEVPPADPENAPPTFGPPDEPLL